MNVFIYNNDVDKVTNNNDKKGVYIVPTSLGDSIHGCVGVHHVPDNDNDDNQYGL